MDNYNSDKKSLKQAMLKRALGYDYEEKIIEATKEGKTGKVKVLKKHVPPDPDLIEKILYLMQCGKW